MLWLVLARWMEDCVVSATRLSTVNRRGLDFRQHDSVEVETLDNIARNCQGNSCSHDTRPEPSRARPCMQGRLTTLALLIGLVHPSLSLLLLNPRPQIGDSTIALSTYSRYSCNHVRGIPAKGQDFFRSTNRVLSYFGSFLFLTYLQYQNLFICHVGNKE